MDQIKYKLKSNHECKQQRIKSISEDIVFSAKSGKKTSKQLISGLAMKSLTGFRRFIEILNRLGHTAITLWKNYKQVSLHVTETGNLTPTGMTLNLEQATSVAFNNFNRL